MYPSQQERGATFKALHEGDPFLIPNPWDAGTAKVLESLGFPALATTSGGFAFTQGRSDGGVGLEGVVEHTRELAAATPLPVAVDLENGYGKKPEDAAAAIRAVAAAGAVGGSIEDWDAEDGIYEIEHAVERIAAAAEAAREADFDFTLTARAENFLRGNPDVDDTIARLTAFADAGADVVYAPAVMAIEKIAAICEAVTVPVNVLGRPMMNLEEIYAAGAQRVSIGAQLTWVAAAALRDASTALMERGDLSVLDTPFDLPETFGR